MACLVVVNCPINMDPNWTLPLCQSFHMPCNLEAWKFFPSPGDDDDDDVYFLINNLEGGL